ncbi:MAG: response regulator [Christensenellaceae bacterium]|jgi:response regulator receiver protein|nr:response regulator [Christensenellaceae bacterium]MBS6565078.1 response regulator [Clostridiales bacterium]PWL99767.1 MAG: hypothetical protein DBY09_02845 [Selenomonadales bacterium]
MRILLGTTEQENAFDGQLAVKGIYQSGKELADAVMEIAPDVVITDYILRDLDGIGLLKKLEGLENTKFIVYSELNDAFLARIATSLGAVRVFKKHEEKHQLLDFISSYAGGGINIEGISKERENKLAKYIGDTLKKIGMRPNLLGFNYLLDLIMLLVRNGNAYPYYNNMGKIYQQLADKYGNRPNCIERNIRNSIETAWICGDLEYINALFGFSIRSDKGKPTNSEFIGFICDYISNTFEE